MTSEPPLDRPHPASVALLAPPPVRTVPRRPVAVIGAAAIGTATGCALLAGVGYLAGWVVQDPGATLLAGGVAAAAVTLLIGARNLWQGGSALPGQLATGLLTVSSALCWAQFRDTGWLVGFAVWAAALGGLCTPAARAWCGPTRRIPIGERPPQADSRVGRLRIGAAAVGLAVGVLPLAGSWRLSIAPTAGMWLSVAPVLLLPVALIAGALRLVHRGSSGLLAVTSAGWAAVSVGLLLNRWELRRFFPLEWTELAGPALSQIVAPLVAVALLLLPSRDRDSAPLVVRGGRRPPGMVIGVAVVAFTVSARVVLTVLAESGSLGSLDTGRTIELVAQIILAVGLIAGAVLLLVRREPWVLVGAAVGGAVLPFVPLTGATTAVSALGLLVPGLMIGMVSSPATRIWCRRAD